MDLKHGALVFLAAALSLWLTACEATAVQVIPTSLPTVTATAQATATAVQPDPVTPSRTPTRPAITATGGPSPTPLLGRAFSTPDAVQPTATRILNPNAPRIEFFTSDVVAVAPGSALTLYWSARGADNAVIYRLDREGERTQVWNVSPDGNLPIQTRGTDRGQLTFVIGVGEDETYSEQTLIIPIACPIEWFFALAPEDCPDEPPVETQMVGQTFERGRMVYVQKSNTVYALFNDGREPGWLAFQNNYNPEIHPESEANFIPPPGLFQPLRELGFLWRASEVVRNRLGLGIEEATSYQGFTQTATTPGGQENLYLTSGDGAVLQLIPGGDIWQLITP